MLTPFGIAIRKIRLDRGLKLIDLANNLKLTAAFVSAIETGRKPIPALYPENVAVALGLTAAERTALQRAADRTNREIRVDRLAAPDRELVAAFARQVDSLPEDVLTELRKKLLKSMSGETPFMRNRRGLVVSPRSTKVLWDFADKCRSVLLECSQIEFPIVEVLEFALPKIVDDAYLDICSSEIMGKDEGRVIAGEKCLMLREDVYKEACQGKGRARFTACHEFGHFLLHRETTMARTREDHHPIYQDAEWQADTFAGALLLSRDHLSEFEDARDAAERCGMTLKAAAVMWSKYTKAGLI